MYIVVDKLQKDRGGAEKVLKELCHAFPKATIFTTTVDDIESWAAELGGARIVAPFWGGLIRNRLVWFSLYPLICFLYSFSKIPAGGMALVYSSSAGKFINVNGSKAVLYTNFPARGVFRPDLFFQNSLLRELIGPFLAIFKRYEIAQYRKFKRIYCISKSTKKILDRECNVEASVINCPIPLHWFQNRPLGWQSASIEKSFEYVLISRLTHWKRLDFILDYFESQRTRKLHVIGSGELLGRYKARYLKSCVFHGFVEESELQLQISKYRALIFPTVQEWGLPLIEANACGLPVIAVESEAVDETQIVIKSESESGTCVVYIDESIASIEQALELAERKAWSKAEIYSNADRFRPEIFHRKIRRAVETATLSL